MLSKLKSIAKTMESPLKSHFSHVRNEVEKTTLKPPILETFLELKSVRYRTKSCQNRYQKNDFLKFFK